jgi:hypothetical protein
MCLSQSLVQLLIIICSERIQIRTNTSCVETRSQYCNTSLILKRFALALEKDVILWYYGNFGT